MKMLALGFLLGVVSTLLASYLALLRVIWLAGKGEHGN